MTTSISESIFDDSKFTPSRLHAEGRDGGSYGRPISNVEIDKAVSMGLWKAEPGTFRHPGGPSGETFVVVEGTGSIEVGGQSFPIAPGVIINVPPSTPTVMTVTSLLRKFAVVVR